MKDNIGRISRIEEHATAFEENKELGKRITDFWARPPWPEHPEEVPCIFMCPT